MASINNETFCNGTFHAPIFAHFRHRVRLASIRLTRAAEFNTWLVTCNARRSAMFVLVDSVIYATILCLTYTNLVFAAKFDR